MTEKFKILVINPGSTSTKLAVYENKELIAEEEISHSSEELKVFERLIDETDFRSKLVLEFLKRHNISLDSLDAIVGRGGVIKPIPGGTVYSVNDKMIDDLMNARYGEHASNLGALIANAITKEKKIPAIILDPVVVDEMFPLARYSGLPEIPRRSILHALNHKAVARKFAEERGKKYQECNLIVAHLGGGISVGAHRKSKIVDVNNALNGDGPFTPERSGGLPVNQLVELCFSGKYTKDQLKKMIKGKGGVTAYLGTNDLKEVEQRINSGDATAKEVLEAMIYQVAKEICFLIPAFQAEKIDAIILTGGATKCKMIVDGIRKLTAPTGIEVVVYPGGYEMSALRDGALRILTGEEKELIYS
jgi:butyrate kinase